MRLPWQRFWMRKLLSPFEHAGLRRQVPAWLVATVHRGVRTRRACIVLNLTGFGRDLAASLHASLAASITAAANLSASSALIAIWPVLGIVCLTKT